MKDLKQWVALTVVGCLAILAGGWFLLVAPKRQHAAELKSSAASQVGANSVLETQLVQLKVQAKGLPKEQAKLAAVAAHIPNSRAMPALIRALNKAAKDAGVELVSLTPSATALVAATSTAGTPVSTAGKPVAAAGTSGAAVPTAAAPGATAAGASNPAGQLASIGVTMNVIGGYFQVEQFVSSLEGLQRSMRLTGLTLAPGANPLKRVAAGSAASDNGKSLTTTFTALVYMSANRPPATAVVVPNAAAAK